MAEFALFAFYLCVSALLLVIMPVMMHPTLPPKRKILISIIAFIFMVPGGLALYALVGVPPMAGN